MDRSRILNAALAYCALLFWLCSCSQARVFRGYHYKINIENIIDDELHVELTFKGKLPDTSYFCLPRIVPGVYDALDYGKFVKNLSAIDKKGHHLKVARIDKNCWKIIGTKNLATIQYTTNDGWDAFDFKGIRPYRSSESHFDSSAVIINPNSIFGYFAKQENLPFKINVKKPGHLYGATSLTKNRSLKNEDEYFAESYRALADNPILYAPADTATIRLPGILITVACYSNSKQKIAQKLAEHIAPLVQNQAEYLGGKVATDKYSFIFYHNTNLEDSKYFADGLEHNRSTLLLMYAPMDIAILKDNIYNLASHEFFHTQMPLGLHSYETANFDFSNPKFSKHLWLYEGMTEYFTMHMPVKQKMQTVEQFIHVMEKKIASMKKFKDNVSFTELSKNVMQMPDEYMNVYAKGALINLCLDIELMALSGGNYGVQHLVSDLMNKYGKDKPFNDDDLFGDIYTITGYREIKSFIEKYIEGTDELPIKQQLQKVGLHLNADSGKISAISNMSEAQTALRKHWIGQ
ncbi:hypothetical protein [Paracnuella aquatica]|uniref:M61 family metallopeptidase n=1 Tax=Paracnuella aquatica TaxID=2268757 RepID=UPI00138FD09E|nr:hypothetical protein [Paracnuella aquatica]